jgi:hypothetical protein
MCCTHLRKIERARLASAENYMRVPVCLPARELQGSAPRALLALTLAHHTTPGQERVSAHLQKRLTTCIVTVGVSRFPIHGSRATPRVWRLRCGVPTPRHLDTGINRCAARVVSDRNLVSTSRLDISAAW